MKNKKLLIGCVVLALLVVCCSCCGILVKTFILNNPPLTPGAVVTQATENSRDNNGAINKALYTEKFLAKYPEEPQPEDEIGGDTDVKTSIKNETITGDTAAVVQEIDAKLLKFTLEYKLVKEGSWLTGYTWKIDDVVVPDFANDANN